MEQRHRMTLERMREHLTRADSELEAAQHFLDPQTRDEDEMAFVRAIDDARTLVGAPWRPRGGGLRRGSVSKLSGNRLTLREVLRPIEKAEPLERQ